MNTVQILKTYAITLGVFLVIDLLWIGLFATKLYQDQIGFLLKERFNIPAALIFYLLFVIALLFFVINPALAKDSWQFALFAGAFFGFICYATYDLTNYATLKDWPLVITVIDMAWGAFVGATTSLISYVLIQRF